MVFSSMSCNTKPVSFSSGREHRGYRKQPVATLHCDALYIAEAANWRNSIFFCRCTMTLSSAELLYFAEEGANYAVMVASDASDEECAKQVFSPSR